jgi:hypothetical protein
VIIVSRVSVFILPIYSFFQITDSIRATPTLMALAAIAQYMSLQLHRKDKLIVAHPNRHLSKRVVLLVILQITEPKIPTMEELHN